MMELKPCPFCGSKAKVVSAGFNSVFIRCLNIANCGIKQEWFDTEGKAVEAWNRRVNDGTERKVD